MNPVIENMQKHVSVRDFKNEPLSDDTKRQLLIAAQSGSSSNFVQAFSIIEITDLKLRDQIAQISNSASYVNQTGTFYVFVADLYRQSQMLNQAGESLDGIKHMEQLLVATVDTTIAAEDMAVAAEAMGLGICYIGGIRNDISKVAKLLNLPKYTFPLFGLTVGIPASKNQVKPRLPQKIQVSTNTYDVNISTDLDDYDQTVSQYYANRKSHPANTNWTQKNLDFFKEVRRPDVGKFLKEQGFSLR